MKFIGLTNVHGDLIQVNFHFVKYYDADEGNATKIFFIDGTCLKVQENVVTIDNLIK